jgi:sugar phosphate isomerase/epimerase
VKRIRLGFFKYDPARSPIACLNELRPVLKDIAAACHELGLQAGFQNHSGRSLIGAPVWDVYSLLRELDPASIGMCFDIGHATIEGGLSWPIQARLVEGFYTAVFVKDFTWKRGAEVWKEEWCPLGQGMVSREFFTRLKQTGYQGPICQHHEYALGDVEQMKTSMRRDLEVLRTWLA